MNADLWRTGRADGQRFMAAFLAGLALEAGALAVLLPAMTHQPPPPAETRSIVKLSMLAPAPPAPPPPKIPPAVKPLPPTPPPPPLPLAPPLPPAPPIPLVPERPSLHHPPRPRHTRTLPVQPPAPPRPTPPTPPMATPPAPPAPAQPSAGAIDLFQARMAAAVQRAATQDYPEAAQLAREAGAVLLSFRFEDGAISDVVILQSSGFPLLDAAAMQAVREARYPQQPAEFAGRPHDVRVLVRFDPAPAEVDDD